MACINYAHTNWETPTVKNTDIQFLVKIFRFNIARVRMMMIMPAQVGDLGLRIQKCLDLAEFQATGRLDKEHPSEGRPAAVTERFYELWDEETKADGKIMGTPDWDNHVLQGLTKGLDPVIILGNSGPTGGFQAMFASFIIATWTAFETMAGDLWEAALNIHPAGLSNLDGKATRLRKTNKPMMQVRGSTSDSKLVPLDLIQMNQFDLRQCMGTILRGRFEFGRLEGIREAYASAFHKNCGQIDAALGDDALDVLSAVRNVIVHKAGIADAEYLKRTKYLKLPVGKAGIGALVPLDGQVVVHLIAPAIASASKLLGAVDDWISHAEASTPAP
jgi:hypothetical protein